MHLEQRFAVGWVDGIISNAALPSRNEKRKTGPHCTHRADDLQKAPTRVTRPHHAVSQSSLVLALCSHLFAWVYARVRRKLKPSSGLDARVRQNGLMIAEERTEESNSMPFLM